MAYDCSIMLLSQCRSTPFPHINSSLSQIASIADFSSLMNGSCSCSAFTHGHHMKLELKLELSTMYSVANVEQQLPAFVSQTYPKKFPTAIL